MSQSRAIVGGGSAARATALANAVIAVIREKGYARMRVRDITAISGVTWGAVQHTFGGKNELLLHVATRVSDELIRRLDGRTESESLTLPERVGRVVKLIWSVYGSAEYFAMVEIVRGTRSEIRFNERLIDVLARLSQKIESLWLRLFADAPVSKERSVFCCNVVALTLSGLAARKFYLRVSPQTDAIVDQLIESIALSMSTPRARRAR